MNPPRRRGPPDTQPSNSPQVQSVALVPKNGHIFIGGELAAVSRIRAARYPDRHAVFVGSGYRAGAFEVEAAYPPGSPPTVNGTTPCYPGDLGPTAAHVPEVLRAD